MALTILTGSSQAAGINYSYQTSGSADWSSVPTASYFYDVIDKLPRFRASNGDIQSVITFPFTGSALITGSLGITGSLNVTGGITGSVQGVAATASFAITSSKSAIQILTTADTRSFALTMVESTTSSSLNNPAPIAIHIGAPLTYTVTGAGNTGILNATASYATSASYADIAANATGISSSITNNTNNNILTATGTGVINGESNLTFDSQALTLTNGILTFTGSTFGTSTIQQSLGGAANGSYSHAQGLAVSANGAYSHAEGSSTNALGLGSHAEGSGSFTGTSKLYGAKSNIITSGVFQLAGDVSAVFAPGNRLYYNSAANPDNTSFVVNTSFFGGVNTTITLTNTSITDSNFIVGSLDYSYNSWTGNNQSVSDGGHAEGYYTTTVADWSHAEGSQTQTFARYSHAEGNGTQANGTFSHAEGSGSKTFGQFSHAEGEQTQANGLGSHAEGYLTISSGSYSHAQGNATTSTGEGSHAEGADTTTIGNYSHAEGANTTSTGQYSHSEGEYTTATGQASHAEGVSTISNGKYSHAEGVSTITGNAYGYYATMTASGVFTISSTYGDLSSPGLFDAGYIIGVDDSQYDNSCTYLNLTAASCSFNGTNTLVHVTDTSFLTSTASIGSITSFVNNTGDQYWGGYAAHAQGNSTTAQGSYSHVEGGNSNAYGVGSHAEGSGQAYGEYSHTEGDGYTYGAYSHAEGSGNAYGPYSHAEGSGTAGWTGYLMSESISAGVIKLQPVYGDRTPEFVGGGFVLIEDGNGQIAGVQNTYRYQISSSAFTSSLTQIRLYDTSVNTATADKTIIGVYENPNPAVSDVAAGQASHAEGGGTTAAGLYSHAAGLETHALGWYQSTVGQYNQPISDIGAFIVGDGVDGSNRHNLLVAASGSVTISGSLIVSPTSSGTPAYTGKDGEIVFGQTGANYKIYVWLGGAWRSGSLS